jgi:hypothetical protein
MKYGHGKREELGRAKGRTLEKGKLWMERSKQGYRRK